MNILVTGGAGFIGGNYLRIMVRKYPQNKYICLDALTYAGNVETLSSIWNMPNFMFVKGNICDVRFVDELFRNEHIDVVINFAAETHVDRSIINPGLFLQTNICGTGILLDAALKYKIIRFHQISTDEVYGDLPLDRPDLLFSEDTPLKTSSPYSSSKAAADLLVLSYYRTFGLPVTISRCSNNYGPYQFPEKLIPLVIQKALKDEKLPIYGEGLNVRDWLHVEDHCNAINVILEKGAVGEVYNIGGHSEKTNIEVVKTILKQLGKTEELITHVEDRKGHDRRYAINSSKIKEIGWEPEHEFEEGIRETIEWNLDNSEWVKHVMSGEYLKWLEINYDYRK
ncbi:MAG: dTDP-glucose 4,6-dehydratase [Bacilli bacterium]|jgi:dTDP-glucose 4,6-dehydratase